MTDCNWMQDNTIVEELGYGFNYSQKFDRIKAITEHQTGNYWIREGSKIGQTTFLHRIYII